MSAVIRLLVGILLIGVALFWRHRMAEAADAGATEVTAWGVDMSPGAVTALLVAAGIAGIVFVVMGLIGILKKNKAG